MFVPTIPAMLQNHYQRKVNDPEQECDDRDDKPTPERKRLAEEGDAAVRSGWYPLHVLSR